MVLVVLYLKWQRSHLPIALSSLPRLRETRVIQNSSIDSAPPQVTKDDLPPGDSSGALWYFNPHSLVVRPSKHHSSKSPIYNHSETFLSLYGTCGTCLKFLREEKVVKSFSTSPLVSLGRSEHSYYPFRESHTSTTSTTSLINKELSYHKAP